MRSILYISFLVVATTLSALAQDRRLHIGIQTGIGQAGSGCLVRIDPEVTDQYRRGLALSGALSLRYRIIPQLDFTLAAEVQLMHDGRERVFVAGRRLVTDYKNSLTRWQVPIGLQLRPFSQLRSFCISAATGPGFLQQGYTEYAPLTYDAERGSLTIPFDIPANRHLRTDWVYIGGLGVAVTKRLSLELLYQYAKPLAYSPFDPGNTFILVSPYFTRARQGCLFATTYWFN